jgi:hypothetical protein
MAEFRYFPSFPRGARFTTEPCYFCGRTPTLDGVWLDFDDDFDDPPPVCVDDLVAGRVRVAIPQWVRDALACAVHESHPEWDATRQSNYVTERTEELAHTPPVPWIQENEWPVCADDYAVFLRQLTREDLERRHEGPAGGKAALQRIMAEQRPNWQSGPEALDVWWDRLGGFLRLYAFACESKQVYVLQTM